MAFCLTQLQTSLTHSIITWLVTTHSVLGGTQSALGMPPGSADVGLLTLKTAFLTLPIEWANHLIGLCLYTAAMIAISSAITQRLAGDRPSVSATLSVISRSGSRILLVAFKILLLIGCFAILGAALMFLTIFAGIRPSNAYMSPQYIITLVTATLFLSAIGYLMAPSALALLRPLDAEPISSETVRLARISAVLTELASGAIAILMTRVGHSFAVAQHSPARLYALEAGESLVAAAPYILLFIALSLLAMTQSPTTDEHPVPVLE